MPKHTDAHYAIANRTIAIPPHWQISPAEYAPKAGSRGSRRTMAGMAISSPLAVTAVAQGAAVAEGPVAATAVVVGGLAAGVGGLMGILHCAVDGTFSPRRLRWLAAHDPAEILDLSDLPAPIQQLASPREEITVPLFEALRQITKVAADAHHDSPHADLLDLLLDEHPALLEQAARAALRHSGDETRAAGANLHSLLLSHHQMTGTPAAAGADPSGSRRATWAQARVTHQRIVEAWTDVVCDPYAALLRPALLDVTVPRTGEFIEAYTSADDLLRVLGERYPGDVDAGTYITATARLDRAWNEALSYADALGADVVPTDDRATYERAVALAATASNTAATGPERALAARHLNRLVLDLPSIELPGQGLVALARVARGELAPSPS